MGAFGIFLATAIVLPLAITEFGDWCPHMAKRIATWAAGRLGDADAAERYAEEWQAELIEIPGKLAPVAIALTYVVKLPRMRRTIRRQLIVDSDPQPAACDLPAVTPRLDTDRGESPWDMAVALRQDHTTQELQRSLRIHLLKTVLADDGISGRELPNIRVDWSHPHWTVDESDDERPDDQ